jgi:catechol 2,3-dioxygenase-like lactoylglutathione lyase family enzyme
MGRACGRGVPDAVRAIQVPAANRFCVRNERASVWLQSCRDRGGDVEAAVAFYGDVFGLEKLDEGEGDAFFKLGEHQFLAMFENKGVRREQGSGHFGIMVRDEAQIAEVRDKLVNKYRLKLLPGFRCDFRDPWGNRIQVVDLHDESLIWLLPYREVQKAGVRFGDPR